MKKGFLVILLAGLVGCLPKPNSGSNINSITDSSFKGKKFYFAFNGSDTKSMSNTALEPMFDAYNLGAVFSRSSGGNYATDITYDAKKVNRAFLMAKLDEYAAKLGPEDMFIMYTGSHGTKDGLYLGDETVAYDQIVEKVLKFQAKEVIIFMMACHSGAFSSALTKQHQQYARWSQAGRTLFVLASSQANETSSTFPSNKLEGAPVDPLNVPGNTGTAYGNTLWRAIRGDADVNNDKKVTLKETYDYVVRNTQKLAGHKPRFAGSFPHDLVLTLVEGAATQEKAAVNSSDIDELLKTISALDSKVKSLISKINELEILLPIESEDGDMVNGADSGDSGDGTMALTSGPAGIEEKVVYFVREIEKEQRMPSTGQASETQKRAQVLSQLLLNLGDALTQLLAKVAEPAVRSEITRLESELEVVRKEYSDAAENLRLKIIDNLSTRP